MLSAMVGEIEDVEGEEHDHDGERNRQHGLHAARIAGIGPIFGITTRCGQAMGGSSYLPWALGAITHWGDRLSKTAP